MLWIRKRELCFFVYSVSLQNICIDLYNRKVTKNISKYLNQLIDYLLKRIICKYNKYYSSLKSSSTGDLKPHLETEVSNSSLPDSAFQWFLHSESIPLKYCVIKRGKNTLNSPGLSKSVPLAQVTPLPRMIWNILN